MKNVFFFLSFCFCFCVQNYVFLLKIVCKEKEYKKSTQENCMWNSEFWLNKVD